MTRLIKNDGLFQTSVVAIQAGSLVMQSYLKRFAGEGKLEFKSTDGLTPVGEGDRMTGYRIAEVLRSCFPHITCVDEDLGVIGDPDSNDRCYIDGIDGTSQFLRRFEMLKPVTGMTFTRNDELYFALIADPMRNKIVLAEKGSGAYEMPFDGGDLVRLQVKPGKTVKERIFAEDALSYPYTDARFGKFIAGVNRFAQNRRTWASCLAHAAYVAQNLVDFTVLHAIGGFWDLGGCLIAQEAGGIAADVLTGQPVTHYGDYQLVLVDNGADHDELFDFTRECYGTDYKGFRGKE